MLKIAWRMLAQRPASVIATFLALSFAAMIVTGCGVMLESGIRYHGTVGPATSAPVVVATTRLSVTDGSGEDAEIEYYPLADRSPLPPDLAGQIAALPGVGNVEVTSARRGAALVLGVHPGAGVSTTTVADEVRHLLDAAAHRPDGAYPEVFTGTERGEAQSLAVGEGREFVIAVSSTFGGCALLIALIVITGSVGLSIRQRHRDIALLRAIAATPRQVRRLVTRESALLAIAATTVGVLPGLWGARWLRTQYVTRGLVPANFHTHTSWLPPVVAFGSVLVIAVVAAWIGSLRPSRTPPSQAMAESVVERGGIGPVRAILGVLALAGGVTLAVVSGSVDGDAAAGIAVGTVFTLVVAVALLGPLIIRGAAAIGAPLLQLLGVTGRLAAANTATSAARLAVVLSSLVLAIGLGGSLWFVQTSEEHVASNQARAGLRADWVVTPTGDGLPTSVAAGLRQVAGVHAATAVVHSTWLTAQDDGTDYSLEGLDTAGLADTVDLGVTSGSLTELDSHTGDNTVDDPVAVDTLTAQALHLHVGSHLSGFFGDGTPSALRVVAIYRRGLGFASLAMDSTTVADHTDGGSDDAVLISLDPAHPASSATLRSTVQRLAPGARLQPRTVYQAQLDHELVENAWVDRVVTGVLLLYAIIAAVNTLAMYGLGRRRELAVLRLAGTTRRQVRRMITLEQIVLLGLALVLGLAIAAATLVPMVRGTTGTPTPYIPASGWVTMLGGVVLLGVLGALAPLRLLRHDRPVAGIGLRD
jgi:putative ABC transport system permease protein